MGMVGGWGGWWVGGGGFHGSIDRAPIYSLTPLHVHIHTHHPTRVCRSEGDKMVLMHKENFTQVEVGKDMLGETDHKFLEEGLALRVQSYEGHPLIVRLPKHMTVRFVWFEVVEGLDGVLLGLVLNACFLTIQ